MRLKLAATILALSICALSIRPGAGQAASAHAPREGVLIASDKQATEAGQAILRQGGTAVDAAIAAALVLAVVAPQSSGPGGAAGALSYQAQSGAVAAWDGSAVAPAAAGADLFLGRDGKPMMLHDIVPGGRAVGVPGSLRMMEALHRAEGRLTWDRLVAPAIALAEDGYTVSPALAEAVARTASEKGEPPAFLALFRDADEKLPRAGDRRTNHALADALRMIAASGADAILRGPVAAEIATTVRRDINPGLLTADDLAAFAVPTRDTFCTSYRAMKLCSLGPPDPGGVALVRALAVLDHVPLPRLDPAGAESAELLAQVWRRSAADGLAQLADPDSMPIRPEELLAPARIAALARGIGPQTKPEEPPAPSSLAPETSEAAVLAVDGDGNAVDLALSLHSPFGAQLAVHGFLLNDALTGFAASGEVANHVEGGKRPLQALAPVLVLDGLDQLRMVAGAPANDDTGYDGAAWLAQLLLRQIDFQLLPRIAMSAPFWRLEGETMVLDDVAGARPMADLLLAKGEKVVLRPAGARVMLLSVDEQNTLAHATPAIEATAGAR
jgi:gamma-glutamyltranspeptidase/glutathione hydrolase